MGVVFGVDPSAGSPLHRQVYEAVRSGILAGRLRPGDRLPATRTLAEQLSIARTTVAEAYDQLQAEGYILGRHGSGTYVAPDLPEEGFKAEGANQKVTTWPVRLSEWGARVAGDKYSDLARASRQDVYRFDFRPHQVAQDRFPWDAWRAAVERALSNHGRTLLSYPPTVGNPALLEAIARHVARYRAVSCSPDQIVIVNGSQQGLNLLAQLLLETGDRVAVEDPGYPAARLTFEARALTVTKVPVDGEGMVVDELARAGPQRMVHVTPSHQEPTGATLSLSRRLALLEVSEANQCLIIEDDYDSEFRYEGRPVESLQGLDRNGQVVYAGTFSKSVLAGLRIGFLILPSSLVASFVAAKSVWDGGAPMLEQAALAEFMDSGEYERHIRRMRRLYRERRDALVAAFASSFGEQVTVGERHGGLNVLVTFDVPVSEATLGIEAAKAGIGLRAASRYFACPPAKPTFLFGFAGLPQADIRLGVQHLADLISGLPPVSVVEKSSPARGVSGSHRTAVS